jgi:hypothetical protein
VVAKRYPYEVTFTRDVPDTIRVTLGRYETEYLASRCAGLIRACVTEGEVETVFNPDASESS